jgi:hypothetical protein
MVDTSLEVLEKQFLGCLDDTESLASSTASFPGGQLAGFARGNNSNPSDSPTHGVASDSNPRLTDSDSNPRLTDSLASDNSDSVNSMTINNSEIDSIDGDPRIPSTSGGKEQPLDDVTVGRHPLDDVTVGAGGLDGDKGSRDNGSRNLTNGSSVRQIHYGKRGATMEIGGNRIASFESAAGVDGEAEKVHARR